MTYDEMLKERGLEKPKKVKMNCRKIRIDESLMHRWRKASDSNWWMKKSSIETGNSV